MAAIQGYLETLLANPCLTAEKRTAFLEKSCAQVERLRHLLSDVATITRMDEGRELIGKEPVVLNDLIDEVRADMELRPEGQRLRVNCDFQGPVEVEGNPSLLSSVFRNLADNAAAYSGGRDIFIRLLSDTAEACTILFADNGIGVDEEHLPHLFERFYRIDKGLAQAGRHGTRAFDRQKRRRDPRRDDHRTQRRTRRAGIRFHPAQTFIRAQPDCNVFVIFVSDLYGGKIQKQNKP